MGDGELIKFVTEHVKLHYGSEFDIYHELASQYVHVDVFRIRPSRERPYWTLLTCGMSQRPMTVGDDIRDRTKYQYAELTLCLPPSWPMTEDKFEDRTIYWPIGAVTELARYPHKCNTWFWIGHSIPAGGYIPGTDWTGFLFREPLLMPEEARSLRVEDRGVSFMALCPVFEDEMNFKLRAGVDELEEALKRYKVTEPIDLKRPNVMTGRRPTVA